MGDKNSLVFKEDEISDAFWMPIGQVEKYFGAESEKAESIKKVIKEVDEFKKNNGL